MRRLAVLVCALLAGCGGAETDRAEQEARAVGLRMVNSGAREGDAVGHARFAGAEIVEAADQRVVVRLRLDGFDRWGQPVTDPPRCFAYELDGGLDEHEPHAVDCPRTGALKLPPAPRQPTLPADAERRIERALRSRPADLAAAVRGRLRDRDARVTAEPGGVAAAAGDDCVSPLPRARVEVWRPSRVQLQPGELTCDAATAVAGAGQRPPH